MATRFTLLPMAAEFSAANTPAQGVWNGRPTLDYDAATNESADWTAIAPAGWTGTITAKVHYIMASATSGDVDIDVQVEAVSDGDALDLDSASSFDTANSTDNTTVPATAGYIDVVSITLTNNDGSVAGDYMRFRVTRDAANDTAAGDLRLLAVEISDGA